MEIKDEPDNPRYWFYLAQAYETVNQPDPALSAYEKRAAMGDYIAEVWYSHYRMAKALSGKGERWKSSGQLSASP